jgi:hypothetical protein
MERVIRKSAILSLCGYEIVAVSTGKVPTLSALSQRHRWFAPLLIAGLTGHLYFDPRRKTWA